MNIKNSVAAKMDSWGTPTLRNFHGPSQIARAVTEKT